MTLHKECSQSINNRSRPSLHLLYWTAWTFFCKKKLKPLFQRKYLHNNNVYTCTYLWLLMFSLHDGVMGVEIYLVFMCTVCVSLKRILKWTFSVKSYHWMQWYLQKKDGFLDFITCLCFLFISTPDHKLD